MEKRHSTKPVVITDLEKVEALAASGVSAQRAAGELGVGYNTFQRHIQGFKADRSVYDAWQRGIARRESQSSLDRVANDAQRLQSMPVKPTQIGMEITESELSASTGIAPVTPPGNPSMITLSNGAQIAIGFNGNFFGLTREERQTMNAIAELLEIGQEATR